MTASRHRRAVRLAHLLACAAIASLAWTQAAAARSSTRAHAAAAIGAYTTTDSWSFVSAPRLHPPSVAIASGTKVQHSKLAHGYFLLDNFPNLAAGGAMYGEGGPLILDEKLRPVWFYPVGTGVVSTDLREQVYNGEPVLTWWQGIVDAHGDSTKGQVVVVDGHYRRIATLTAQAPWVISVHDAVISGEDMWVTVYRQVPGQDLSAYGGSANGAVYDSGVQEYDLKTGALLYTWDALNPGATASVPLSDSETKPTPGSSAAWDAYHINSVQPVGANEILVSLRNTWAAYLINTTTGQTVWKLGGDPNKPSSFAVPSDARFEFQHDVQLQGNVVTMFDDACCAFNGSKFLPPVGPSRGLVLNLNLNDNTVTLAHQYAHSPKLDSAFLGSTSLLPNGNALIGWGSLPYFTEYSSAGQPLLDAAFPGGGKDLSYRALFSSNWVGTPYFSPSGALARSGAGMTVYASWDGATGVVRWQVLAGSDAKHLRPIASRARTGFETAMPIPAGSYSVFKVRALGTHGRDLGTSGLFPQHHKRSSLPQSY